VRVLQGKTSNYDTDIFSGTIQAIEKITGKVYDPALTPADSTKTAAGINAIGGGWEGAVAFRVLADHIRAISFAIADGQLPSNTGAGYVIRRILRRAVRYYYSYLDYKQPLLFQLLPLLAKQFEMVFPELIQQLDFVSKVVKEEEEAFLRTLDKGLKRMDETIQQSQSTKVIDGAIAFELYDTFGFPLDLTMLIATENNLKVDEAGFQKQMEQQKNRSRSAAVLDTEDWITLVDNLANQFTGYDSLEAETSVIKYRKVSSKSKAFYQLILAATPFYAESGGQVGDTGTLFFGQEAVEVTNTKKENDLIIHFTEQLPISIDGAVVAKVNVERRQAISVHHSVTHLMHSALRNVLGKHVAQKGSLVNEEQLRFDFSHFAKVTEEEVAAVEKIVNAKIRENVPVIIRSMHKDEAIALGATALFGEKYGDTVRVVTMDPQYSLELCGGTHVGFTGELGIFKIKHEAAVAAGVRRIEAVCGSAAEQFIQQTFAEFSAIRTLLKNPVNIEKYIENLTAENSVLSKKMEGLEVKQLIGIRNELLQKVETINEVSFIGEIVAVSSADALKKLCVDCKTHLPDHVIVLCANIDGKAFVALGISENLVAAKKLDAAKIVREQVAGLIQGGGGGQATIATAGGQNISQLGAVIEAIKSLL
jgi:alanyl-tRNA synthetase